MALPSGLPDLVANDELVVRHVFNRHHIASDSKNHLVKWAKPEAFHPQPSGEGWLFSVTRALMLVDSAAIERNGLAVGRVSKRGLKGCARLLAAQVRDVPVKKEDGTELHHLDVVAHEEADGSTPHHAHISGFLPLPEGAQLKEYFKEIAEELHRKAKENSFTVRSLPEEEWEKQR